MLTRSGLGVGVAAVLFAICGVWWNYAELIVAGVALAVAVGVAVWGAQVPMRVVITRSIGSLRVARGDPIRAVYRVTNTSRRASAGAVLIDRFDDLDIRVEVPPVAGSDRVDVIASLPTRRRGEFEIGPWILERVDAFGLVIGLRAGEQISPVIVHPRVHRLQGPYGTMHTIEDEAVIRTAASDPLSGFVSLREYVEGDDPRLIHWPTSARMGTLMTREHVELRRPEFTVVLDCAASASTEDDFEEMVDVAASIAVHAMRSGVDVTLRTTSRLHPGAFRPIRQDTRILDLLTPVTRVDPEHHMTLVEIFHAGLNHTRIIFVTGPTGPSTTFVRSDRLSVIRIGDGAESAPGVALAVDDATTFAQVWRPWS